MAVAGRMEVIIKINELPSAKEVQNSWKSFEVDCDGKIISITVKPKIWKKFEEAQANYPMWVAAISGRMGASTPTGFILDQPNVQVFERKPREAKSEQPEATV
ncbi:MAG: hypothetical protein Kow00121_04920 [Elainellaceae cyanobacterium]